MHADSFAYSYLRKLLARHVAYDSHEIANFERIARCQNLLDHNALYDIVYHHDAISHITL